MRREIRVRKERDEKIQVNERDNCIAEVCIGNNTKLLFSPSIMFYEKYKKKKRTILMCVLQISMLVNITFRVSPTHLS